MSSFELVKLGSIVSIAAGTGFPHAAQGRKEGEYPFYKVGDMNKPGNEREMFDADNWIDEEIRAQLRARVWPAGTVIFPKVGAALKTEKRRILTRESAFDNNVMGLVPGDRIVPRFLLAVMETIRFGAFAQEGVVPSINNGLVSGLEVPLPTLAQQQVIVDVLSAADQMADSAREHAMRAKGLRVALSAALLSGEHDLNGTNDD